MENVPLDKLHMLQEMLALSDEEIQVLRPYREIFVSRKEEFADYLHGVFMGIPETRFIIERVEEPGRMKKLWAGWFENLFERDSLDERFLSYLWRIGLRHVEVGLDQRFTNLGFSVVRQFCQKVIMSEVAPEKRADAAMAVDKLIDMCLLVETSAYITATTRCDLEIIKGIADKVRNKITIIGGSISMLKRKIAPSDPAFEIYESLLMESAVCEHMVRDINVYNDMFQREPELKNVPLRHAIERALERLRPGEDFKDIRIDIALEPGATEVHADTKDLNRLFFYTLENALEAASGEKPSIRISSSGVCVPSGFVCIEIFNSGIPPKPETIGKFFSPFYSTKTEGSGFGIPIASLAARKNFGTYIIEPADNLGTRVRVTLPAPI